jgi:hypothetical protein
VPRDVAAVASGEAVIEGNGEAPPDVPTEEEL